MSFYAKESDMRRAYFSQMPMILLMYKEAYFATNELDNYLPSVFISLLKEYSDLFSKEIPKGLPPLREIEH